VSAARRHVGVRRFRGELAADVDRLAAVAEFGLRGRQWWRERQGHADRDARRSVRARQVGSHVRLDEHVDATHADRPGGRRPVGGGNADGDRQREPLEDAPESRQVADEGSIPEQSAPYRLFAGAVRSRAGSVTDLDAALSGIARRGVGAVGSRAGHRR
jgi:hypothetical protein